MSKFQSKKILISLSLLLAIISAVLVIFLFLDSLLGINNTDDLIDRVYNPTEESIKLEINVDTEERQIYEGFLTVLIETNKEIDLQKNNRMNMILVKEEEGKYFYVLEISNIDTGKSIITININDKQGNTETLKIPVDRDPGFSFQGQSYVPAWPNTTYIIDGNDLLTFLNKERRLLVTYEPSDLVNLRENYIDLYVNDDTFVLRKEAADNLDLMLKDMREEINKNVVIASAYRSYETQAKLYSGYVAQYGQEETDKFSARPGYSEHQLGTVVDFVNEESGFQFNEQFGETEAGVWLKDNSYLYGFIMSYPNGTEEVTGYAYEPWQFRYIGVENAKELKESGLIWVEWIQSK